MDQDPCGDLAVAPCEVKLRWEAGAFLPGTSAHGLPALEHPIKGGKGASAVRAFSFWSILLQNWRILILSK